MASKKAKNRFGEYGHAGGRPHPQVLLLGGLARDLFLVLHLAMLRHTRIELGHDATHVPGGAADDAPRLRRSSRIRAQANNSGDEFEPATFAIYKIFFLSFFEKLIN